MFNNTVSTERSVDTVDSGGSPITTFSTHISSLTCRIQQKTGTEPILGGRQYSQVAYILYCAADADVLMKDRINYTNQTFNVVDSRIEGNSNAYLKVSLEKID
jgi:head-tail adaptor